MPYKVFGKCLYKLNPDGSKGKLIKCHDSPAKAAAQARALYANVEKTMATKSNREKRRAHRLEARAIAKQKELEQEQLPIEDELEEEDALLEAQLEAAAEKDLVEKDMYGAEMSMMGTGPTSFAELDEMQEAMERNEEIQDTSYNVQQLVRNIIYHPAHSVEEKANLIKAVGTEFGTRVQQIMDKPIEKELDMDLLEIEALIAKDNRSMSVVEKVGDWIEKKKLTAAAENKLSDSDFALVVERDGKKVRKYPIHDKAHVRNAMARAAQMMERGGEAATDAKSALPKIKAAAKKMGIGMEKGLIIEKDASGSWRAVMWPSNNFKDWDGEIISEKAHTEYVDWVNKNMDCAPVFVTWHRGGTRRESQVDFAAYENGFLLMSAPLTENEAAGLFEAQKITDIGMSHGSFVLERTGDVIEKYRMVEVSDLPLENAANPFTDFAILTKEADMDTKKYLATILGSDELAEKYLAKTGMKQKDLREAGVKEAEKVEEKEVKLETIPEAKPAPATDAAAIVAQVLKELDVEGLQEFLAKSQEALEKVPVLEGLVKDLSQSRDEELAEMITPKVEKKFLWSKARASESDKNVVPEAEKEKVLKEVAGLPDDWTQAFNVTPLQQ